MPEFFLESSLVAQINSNDLPNMLGRLGGLGVASLCMVWCSKIARRPHANAKAVHSLTLLLGVWALALVVGTLHRMGVWFPPILLGIALIALLAGSVLLAFAGLAEIQEKPESFSQGRGQAAFSVICSSGLLLLLGVMVLGNWMRSADKPLETTTRADEQTVLDDDNLAVQLPPAPWSNIDPPKDLMGAKLAFARKQPEGAFIIVTYSDSELIGKSVRQLAESQKAHVRKQQPTARLVSEDSLTLNGLDGLLTLWDRQLGGPPLRIAQWTALRNGFVYQLTVTLAVASQTQDEARAEAETLFSLVRQVDPQRLARGAKETRSLVSERFGYSVQVPGGAWKPWYDIKSKLPDLEFSLKHNDDAFFFALAVEIGRPPSTNEAVKHALLSLCGKSPLVYQPIKETKFSSDGNDGYEVEFRHDLGDTVAFSRYRVIVGQRVAYVFAGICTSENPENLALLESMLAGVVIDPKHGSNSKSKTGALVDDKRQASFHNEVGLYHIRGGEITRGIEHLLVAHRLSPDDPLFLSNLVEVRRRNGQEALARALLEWNFSKFKDDPRFIRLRAAMQVTEAKWDEAVLGFGRLVEMQQATDEDMGAYVDGMLKLGRGHECRDTLKRELARRNSEALHVLLARVYREQGHPQLAIEHLGGALRQAGQSVPLVLALVESLQAAQRHTEALAELEKLSTRVEQSALTFWLRGQSEFALRWYAKAKSSWEEALKRDPTSERLRQDLATVSGMLGEGDNSLVKEPIEPVEIPPSVANLPSAEVDFAPDAASVRVDQIHGIHFVRGRDLRRTEYLRVKLRERRGVEEWSTVQVDFDPLFEQVFVNRLEVKGENGDLVWRGNPSDYYVIDDTSSGMATSKRTLNLPVSGLAPGCAIEFVVTRREKGPVDRFPFIERFLQGTIPCAREVLFVTGDVDGVRYRVSAGLEGVRAADCLYFAIKGSQAFRRELLMPELSTFVPTAWLADSAATWERESARYLAEIEDRLKPSPPIQELARQNIVGMTTDRERVLALAKFVQARIQYRAIEFGRRARVPDAAETVIAKRFGDCKDHALLLYQLLRGADIASELALARVGGPVQRDLPALDQFDHMVVYVPGFDKGWIFDATWKQLNLAAMPPFTLAGKEVFLLDAKAPRFFTVPRPEACAYRLSLDREITLDQAGDLVTREKVRLDGYAADVWRSILGGVDRSQHGRTLADHLAPGTPGLKVTDARVERLEEPEHSLEIAWTYSLKGHFHPASGRLVGRLPALWERYWLDIAQGGERTGPLALELPLSIHSAVRARFPEGHAVAAETKGASESAATSQVRWSCKAAQSANELSLEARIERRPGTVPAEQFGGFQNDSRAALALVEALLTLEPSAKDSRGP